MSAHGTTKQQRRYSLILYIADVFQIRFGTWKVRICKQYDRFWEITTRRSLICKHNTWYGITSAVRYSNRCNHLFTTTQNVNPFVRCNIIRGQFGLVLKQAKVVYKIRLNLKIITVFTVFRNHTFIKIYNLNYFNMNYENLKFRFSCNQEQILHTVVSSKIKM